MTSLPPENAPPTKVPFSAQAVQDGYWEIYHDDDCGVALTSDGYCPACKFHPDLQSKGARRANWKPVAAPENQPRPTAQPRACWKCGHPMTEQRFVTGKGKSVPSGSFRCWHCANEEAEHAGEAQGEVPQPWDRAEVITQRIENCGWATIHDRAQFVGNIRVAMEAEVEARAEPGAHPPPGLLDKVIALTCKVTEKESVNSELWLLGCEIYDDICVKYGPLNPSNVSEFPTAERARAPQTVSSEEGIDDGLSCEISRTPNIPAGTTGRDDYRDTDRGDNSEAPVAVSSEKGFADVICAASSTNTNPDSNSVRIGESEQTAPVAPSKLSAQEFYETWRSKYGTAIQPWTYSAHAEVCDFAEQYASSSNAALQDRIIAHESKIIALERQLREAAKESWIVKKGLMELRDSTELTPQAEEWIETKIEQWKRAALGDPKV